MDLNESLLSNLQCPDCAHNPLEYSRHEETLSCQSCSTRYPAKYGIASMLKSDPESQDWNPWEESKAEMMGVSYYKRSTGEMPEKESSKSFARFLDRHKLYVPGDTLLDIGCAAGHFLRSFRRLLDPDILYTGIDSNFTFLRWGQKAYGENVHCDFVHCDALQMPFVDNSFDLVIVNLFQFFPRIDVALREAMRVASKSVIWRTPVGPVNYVVKILNDQSFEELGALTPQREDFDYTLCMLYSKRYIEGLMAHLDGGELVFIERDEDFGDFDNSVLEEFAHTTTTKTVNGMQINGSLVMDWHYVVIHCK